jgi:hypothetical protein
MRQSNSNFVQLGRQIAFVTALAGLVTLIGCAGVEPYEREYLADPIMNIDDGPQGAYEQHMHRALEAGLAGQPAPGGGCGCEQ